MRSLRFAPGVSWEYGNLGYFALAETIRRVAARPWTEYLNERVFAPAGMSSTFPTWSEGDSQSRAWLRR